LAHSDAYKSSKTNITKRQYSEKEVSVAGLLKFGVFKTPKTSLSYEPALFF